MGGETEQEPISEHSSRLIQDQGNLAYLVCFNTSLINKTQAEVHENNRFYIYTYIYIL